VPARKRITDEQHDGYQGEPLAEFLVKAMGHEYHRAGPNEAGIDGFIELRQAGSGEVDAQIIVCQVKTGESVIFDETETEFSWRADPGDLVYWENSNAPVIVIVARLPTMEGWWRAGDEAFSDENARAQRVVRFNKTRDRLNGARGEGLWEVIYRARDRHALAARMAMNGPYATIGLTGEIDAAMKLEQDQQWSQAADSWNAIADAAKDKGLERRLVWPARGHAAQAFQYAGQRVRAGEVWLGIAAERLDDDDPLATFDLGRARWTGAWTDTFDQMLMAIRAELPEAGIDALDDLRAVQKIAHGARERQAAAAALVDALVFFAVYEEAFTVSDKVLGKVHDTPQKRQLSLDWLDCGGEIGRDVEMEWAALLADRRDRGPHLYGQALQRRAVFALRRGDAEEARARFREAAELWARTDGGEEQVAEVAFSTSLVGSLSDHLHESMPPGARAAAAIARGSIRTPAVRSDQLLMEGLLHLVDDKLPDALSRLTLAAMIDRRAGNLFSWRRTVHMLARAYEDADEHVEALRFWLSVGAEQQAAAVASKVDADVVTELLRLGNAPIWEQAAGLAALERHAAGLSPAAVATIAPEMITAAEPRPRVVGPQPSFYARRILARMCDRLPAEYGAEVGALLTDDLRLHGPSASESSAGLVRLTQRGLFDGVPVIIEALLAGDQLPVTIAGWLRDADELVRRPLVDAALGGNRVALSEAAAADLPADDARLQDVCDRVISAAVDADPPEEGVQVIGLSFVELADLARFARPETQTRFVDMLSVVVASPQYDEVAKTSALITVAIAAPGLSRDAAERALGAFLDVARGAAVESAPAVISDHANLKRARTQLTRSVPGGAMRGAAIQACGRLARRAEPTSNAVETMLREALGSDEPEVMRMALRELAGLPELCPDVDPIPWETHPDETVRTAADQLAAARRGEPTTD
jgi:hypothetical protein